MNNTRTCKHNLAIPRNATVRKIGNDVTTLSHTTTPIIKIFLFTILHQWRPFSYILDCSIFTVFLTVKNSSQILLFILFLLMNTPLRMLHNGSPIGWCRSTEQTVTKYRQQQR